MFRIIFYIHLLSMVILGAFGTPTQVDQRISDVIAENVLQFGHNVGLELAAFNETESKIFSPLSLMTALSLLTLGAKGKSYQELKHIIGLDSDNVLLQHPNRFHEEFGLMLTDLQHKNLNRGVINTRPNARWRSTNLIRNPPYRYYFREPVDHIIKVANGLFVQNGYSLNLDYRQVLKHIYETEFTQLDFQLRNAEARDYINDWVKKATFGKIPQIIRNNIEKTTKVILASTLYFKAFWETQFFADGTIEDNFFPDGVHNPPIKIQMMPVGGTFPFYDAREYDCRIIGLPYRGSETTMYIIQPNESSRRKLRELQQMLDAQKLNSMIDKMERKTAVIGIPKMHFKSIINMKKILQNMNVHDIFENEHSDLSLIGERAQNGYAQRSLAASPADISFQSVYRKRPVSGSLQSASNFLQDVASLALSNLESLRQNTDFKKSDLYVDDVIHNVDFSVDEQGTEAAAVTHIILQKTGPDVIFRADTPFLVLIRHDPTKLSLFYGIINKPEIQANNIS